MAQEITRQSAEAVDLKADATQTEVFVDSDGKLQMNIPVPENPTNHPGLATLTTPTAPQEDAGEFLGALLPTEGTVPETSSKSAAHGRADIGINKLAHRQIGSRLGVPAKYYDKMHSEAPELLATNINHWLSVCGDRRMLRILDCNLRAYLSDSYRPLDNLDLAMAVLPILNATPNLQIISCELTETRFYIKAINTSLEAEIRVGDVAQAGIIISNSEVGQGSLRIQPFIYRLWCLNGCTSADSLLKKYHVGSRTSTSDDVYACLTDETKRKTDEAIWNQVKDVTGASIQDGKMFDSQINRHREAAGVELTGDPMKIVEVLSKVHTFSDTEQTGTLQALFAEADMSQYGLMNAVTRMSQDVPSYDRASELERVGGKIVEMTPAQWSSFMAKAPRPVQVPSTAHAALA